LPIGCNAQSAVASITPKEITMSHIYISIPALDHKVFKYAGYQPRDLYQDWHRKNGILGSAAEVEAGPYRVKVSSTYLGDQVDEKGRLYDCVSYVSKQFVLTKKQGNTPICELWMRQSRVGDDAYLRSRAIVSGCMLHCFPVDMPSACETALERHTEIEQAQPGLEERVAEWRQS
jgi:hypothetical protein